MLQVFLGKYCAEQYDSVFVDPDQENKKAIRVYEKAGFKKVKENLATKEIWMLRSFS